MKRHKAAGALKRKALGLPFNYDPYKHHTYPDNLKKDHRPKIKRLPAQFWKEV